VIAIPCVIFAAWLGMIACARSLYFEFGWAIFHVVGASPSMKGTITTFLSRTHALTYTQSCTSGTKVCPMHRPRHAAELTPRPQ
jgi:hypothetical protein